MKFSAFLLSLLSVLSLFSCAKEEADEIDPNTINIEQWQGTYHGNFSIDGVTCGASGTYFKQERGSIKVLIVGKPKRFIFQSEGDFRFDYQAVFPESQISNDCTLGDQCVFFDESAYACEHRGEFAITPSLDQFRMEFDKYEYGCGRTIHFIGVKE